MLAPHVITLLGATGGGVAAAWLAAKPVCQMVLGIIALFRCEKKDIPAVMEWLSPWRRK
jgi:hypothetical protein